MFETCIDIAHDERKWTHSITGIY